MTHFEPKQRTGSAIGLMQIIPVVLADYNTRNGTHYKPEHLVDPSINVAIGCELLVIIIAGCALTILARLRLIFGDLQSKGDKP